MSDTVLLTAAVVGDSIAFDFGGLLKPIKGIPITGRETPVLSIASRLARRTPFFYGWVVLFAASASQFSSNAAASLTISAFMYPMSQDLGWSRTLIAGAASMGGLMASLASPLVGWLIDRYGVRIVLSVSIFVLGLAIISVSWATIPIAFYFAFGTGRLMFSSPIKIGSSVAVSQWFIKKRGRATGVLFLSHSAGMVLFPLMAAIIIQTRGWQDAWVFLGLFVWIAALAPVFFLIIRRPEDVGLRPDGDAAADVDTPAEGTVQKGPVWTLSEAMRTPTLWLLALAAGFLFMVQAGTNVHIAAYFRDQGLSATVAASALSLIAVFTGIGSLMWGRIIEKFPVRYVFATVALFMSASSMLFLTTDTAVEALLYSSLFGMSIGGILVVPPVAFANYFGRRSLGAIRGVTEPFASLGQAFGVLLSGVVFDATGSYQIAFLTFATFGAATIVIMLLTKPPRHISANVGVP